VSSWILLDADKSQFVPGPGPEDRKMIFEPKRMAFATPPKDAQRLSEHHRRHRLHGQIDGKDYPITGTGLDTVSLKRIDANTIERTGKVRGKVTETAP